MYVFENNQLYKMNTLTAYTFIEWNNKINKKLNFLDTITIIFSSVSNLENRGLNRTGKHCSKQFFFFSSV